MFMLLLFFSAYIGCFTDKRDRLLPGGRQDSANNRTIQNCIQHCKSLKYAYAGVEVIYLFVYFHAN